MLEDASSTMDISDIVKPSSAYHHFAKQQSSVIKEDLIQSGQDSSIGCVTSAVAAKVICSFLSIHQPYLSIT